MHESEQPYDSSTTPPVGQGAARTDHAQRIQSLVEHNTDFVWRVLRRLGVQEATVDDAAQQVMMIAARRISTIELGRERSFLFATATRVASEMRRSWSRRMDHPAENGTLDGTPHDSHSPEELLDRRRAAQLLDCVLDEMTDDCRQVLVLFEFEQMSTPEIAQLVGIPLGTAASRLRRARESFKNAVAELESRYKQTGAQP